MSLKKLIEEKKRQKKREATVKTVKNVSLGALTGAMAGIAAGLLFAPKSGKETREDIKNATNDVNETLKTKVSEAKTETLNNFTEAKSKINAYLAEKRNAEVTTVEEKTIDVEPLEEVQSKQED